MQGKTALNFLQRQIESDYFPIDQEKALIVLQHGPLSRPKVSLVRNFTVVLLKEVFFGDRAGAHLARIRAILKAVRQMHRTVVEAVFREKLSDFMRKIEDGRLNRAIWFLYSFQDLWDYLDPDMHVKLQTYVTNLPKEALDALPRTLKITYLQQQARTRVAQLSLEELELLLAEEEADIPTEYLDRAVNLFVGSGSYKQSNTIASRVLLLVTSALTPEQVKAIMKAAGTNTQVKWASNTRMLLNKIREVGIVSADEYAWLVEEYQLGAIIGNADSNGST